MRIRHGASSTSVGTSHRFPRGRKTGAFLLVLGLLSAMFTVFAPGARAAPIVPGNLGDFAIDGDQTTLATGNLIDWQTVKTDPRITQWALIHDDNDPDTNDSTYIDSAKEQDPSTWGCAAAESPPKDDIFRLYLASQITAADQLLHLGYVRSTGTGDTDINIEFNQLSGQFSCPGDTDGRIRTDGDLMISFTFGGGNDPSVIEVYRWDSTVGVSYPGDPPPDIDDKVAGDGHWDLVLVPVAAVGADNAGKTIVDYFFESDTLAKRTFGEVTLDLGLLFDNGLLDCPGLGFVTVHSRASHSFSSDLKDLFPETSFNLSDCGSLRLKKVDERGRPMGGVTFGLYTINGDETKGALAQLPTAPPTDLTCITSIVTATLGVCTIPRIPAGTYLLDEIDLPAGYMADPDLPYRVTIGAFENIDLSDAPGEWFVNTLKTGSVTVTKLLADGEENPIDLTGGTGGNIAYYDDFLVGARFDLRQGGVNANNADGTPAFCVIETSGINLETNTASCTITRVLYGDYIVHETAPPGTNPLVNDKAITVDADPVVVSVSFTNIVNPDTVVLKATTTPIVNAGDGVSFTLTVTNAGEAPARDVVLTDTLDGDVSGWAVNRPDPPCAIAGGVLTCNAGTLEPRQSWAVTLTGTATPAACPSITNRAHVSSSNETEADAAQNNSEIITVTVNCPNVRVAKSTLTPTVNSGDQVTFSIVVTNDGPGVAKDVAFTDDLPDGVIWSFDPTAPAGCSLNASNNLVCAFLDPLGDDASVTISLKGMTDPADCQGLSNPVFGVSASNETAAAAANNATIAVPITVRCPAITVAKTGSAPINAGQDAVYTITVTNAGPGTASGVVVSDVLPAGVTWRAGDPFPTDCDIADGHTLSCTFDSLAVGSVVIKVVGTTDAADCPSLTNLLVSAALSNGAGDSDGPVVIVVNCPDMRVVKTGNGPISGGDPNTPARYTITVTNGGPGEARDVVYTDVLPASLSWTESHPACSIADGRTLTCRWATFPAGDANAVTIVVEALTDPADCPSVTNPISAVASANEAGNTLGNNSTLPATITINCADLELVKDADATSVSRGDPIGFTIKVWNQGDGVAYGATVSDPLPAGFDWDFVAAGSVLPAGATCSVSDANPNVLSCALGNLPAGSSAAAPAAVIHVVASGTLAAACGPYPNTAAVIANNHPLPATDGASLTILCPGLNIVKTADNDLVEAGDQVDFTLEVTNTGPGVAMDVVVSDDLGALPGDLAWVLDEARSDLPEGATCGIASGVLTCRLGDLPATTTAPQVTIHLTAATAVPTGAAGIGPCANYPNVASADPGNGDAVRSETVDVDVRCPLGIELTKTGAAIAHVGDTVTYTFTLTNTGYVDLDTEFIDPICDAGSLVLVDDGDGDTRLEIDLDGATAGLQREVWTYTCTRVVQPADPDPLPNTAMARGTDADGRTVDDTASWVVNLIHPGIEVVKTVSDTNPAVGQTVTYTYVVTNTGDTTLSKVLVTDDILGVIGTIDTLEPGASATLTKTMVVLIDSPGRNIGTATGVDTLGKRVTDQDDAVFTLVLGIVVESTVVAPLAELPRTGFPLRAVAANGLTLMLLGLALQLSRKRNQT